MELQARHSTPAHHTGTTAPTNGFALSSVTLSLKEGGHGPGIAKLWGMVSTPEGTLLEATGSRPRSEQMGSGIAGLVGFLLLARRSQILNEAFRLEGSRPCVASRVADAVRGAAQWLDEAFNVKPEVALPPRIVVNGREISRDSLSRELLLQVIEIHEIRQDEHFTIQWRRPIELQILVDGTEENAPERLAKLAERMGCPLAGSSPTLEDRRAAWAIFVEMRTRVVTQPLGEGEGDDEAALASLYALYTETRQALKEAGPRARHALRVAEDLLNGELRAFLARWHPLEKSGALASREQHERFRAELAALRGPLKSHAENLAKLANGAEG